MEEPESQQQDLSPYHNRHVNRRQAMKVGLGTAAFVVGKLLPSGHQRSKADNHRNSEEIPQETSYLEDPWKIALIPPFKGDSLNPERVKWERDYVETLRKAPVENLDRAFWFVVDPESRAQLLDLRYTRRLTGTLGMKQLSQEQMDWCDAQHIHYEVLGVATDMRDKAKHVVDELLDELRPDVENNDYLPSESYLINAGGLARLICYETGFNPKGEKTLYGFNRIGDNYAVSEINPEVFPQDHEALKELTSLLRKDTGGMFFADLQPGSIRGNAGVNASGGAIGLQFMPGTALELYKLLEKAHYKFNPFDIKSAVLGGYVFLAWHRIFKGIGQRMGYKKGSEKHEFGSLEKWNPHADEINSILKSAREYEFIKN